MEKKSFFRERSQNEIRDMQPNRVYTQRNLVNRIFDLEPSEDALELRTNIIPGKFFAGVSNGAEASRKCYKHGDLIALSQPQTQAEAYASKEIPLAVRARDFRMLKKEKSGEMEKMKEEEIYYVGYSFMPVQERDKRKRVVPFGWLAEGERLFAYAEKITGGIRVKPYADAKRVAKEGAEIFCSVPSRTKNKPRYNVRLEKVPVLPTPERMAIIWGLKSNFEIDPEHRTWNIRYTWDHDREGSDIFTFYPHDIAAYLAVIRDINKGTHNLTPLEMNPFALFSRLGADFYKRLCNNLLIFDPSMSSKDKLRKLHVAEKSILLARAIRVKGHDEIAYWDYRRDGLIDDYNWTPEEK